MSNRAAILTLFFPDVSFQKSWRRPLLCCHATKRKWVKLVFGWKEKKIKTGLHLKRFGKGICGRDLAKIELTVHAKTQKGAPLSNFRNL